MMIDPNISASPVLAPRTPHRPNMLYECPPPTIRPALPTPAQVALERYFSDARLQRTDPCTHGCTTGPLFVTWRLSTLWQHRQIRNESVVCNPHRVVRQTGHSRQHSCRHEIGTPRPFCIPGPRAQLFANRGFGCVSRQRYLVHAY